MIFDHSLDMILTIIVLSFWFLFPVGMFLAISFLEKNSDQILRQEHFPKKKVVLKSSGRPRLLPH